MNPVPAYLVIGLYLIGQHRAAGIFALVVAIASALVPPSRKRRR